MDEVIDLISRCSFCGAPTEFWVFHGHDVDLEVNGGRYSRSKVPCECPCPPDGPVDAYGTEPMF